MFVHFFDVRFHLVAQRHQHLNPLRQSFISLPLKFGIPLHILDGHARGAQLEQELDPTDIICGVAAAGVLLAVDGMDQPDTFLVTQCMRR